MKRTVFGLCREESFAGGVPLLPCLPTRPHLSRYMSLQSQFWFAAAAYAHLSPYMFPQLVARVIAVWSAAVTLSPHLSACLLRLFVKVAGVLFVAVSLHVPRLVCLSVWRCLVSLLVPPLVSALVLFDQRFCCHCTLSPDLFPRNNSCLIWLQLPGACVCRTSLALGHLAPRVVLQCDAMAFKKVSKISPEKLKSKAGSGEARQWLHRKSATGGRWRK